MLGHSVIDINIVPKVKELGGVFYNPEFPETPERVQFFLEDEPVNNDVVPRACEDMMHAFAVHLGGITWCKYVRTSRKSRILSSY
jgi:hypothetical protein